MTKQNNDNTPSKQIGEVSRWWQTVVAASPKLTTLEEIRDFNENWAKLTAEPGGTDYIEVQAAGVQAMWIEPHGCDKSRVLLCAHGGGFFSGSIYTHRKMFAHFANQVGCRALSVNYRRSPENLHPAQVNDMATVYKWLLDQGIKPEHIAMLGDSAGGGLAITTMLLARDQGLPLPGAAMGISAWFDIEGTGESMVSNHGNDHLFTKEWVDQIAQMVLGEDGNPRDPLINPLYGDLAGLPPIYLQVGDQELLLDDSIRFADLAKKSGVEVKLDVVSGMQHTWLMAAGRAPESDEAIRRYVEWVKPKLQLQ